MAYIYCITNLVNGKLYVGKTTYSITKRFKEHCNDSKKERFEKRPLYNAMNKYGIENFVVSLLIECGVEELDSYEKLFIAKLDTYGSNGYNATKGGDGIILFDYEKIASLYIEGKSMVEVASIMQCSVDTVSKVVHLYNLPKNKFYVGSCHKPIKVARLDKDTKEVLQIYDSYGEAAKWLVINGYTKKYTSGVRGKISLCCTGKLKTAYKFIWKKVDDN